MQTLLDLGSHRRMMSRVKKKRGLGRTRDWMCPSGLPADVAVVKASSRGEKKYKRKKLGAARRERRRRLEGGLPSAREFPCSDIFRDQFGAQSDMENRSGRCKKSHQEGAEFRRVVFLLLLFRHCQNEKSTAKSREASERGATKREREGDGETLLSDGKKKLVAP